MEEKLINTWPGDSKALYYRTRLNEKEVQLRSQPLSFEFPSFSELGVRTDFKRKRLYDIGNTEWIRRGGDCIAFTVLSLILSKDIELHKFNDKKYFLFKAISFSKNGFYFKTDKESHDDLLSHLLIKKINTIQKLPIRKQKFEKVINETFISFLGKNKEYNNPPRIFFYKNIEYYSKEYTWLKFTTIKTYLGLKIDYEIEVLDPEIRLQLKKEHELLTKLKRELVLNQKELGVFFKQLNSRIKRNFINRRPSQNN